MSADVPPTPAASVEVIACGDCAELEKIDPLTLLASAIRPCACGCGWDEFVCQICGKPVGIRTTLGRIDLGVRDDAAPCSTCSAPEARSVGISCPECGKVRAVPYAPPL